MLAAAAALLAGVTADTAFADVIGVTTTEDRSLAEDSSYCSGEAPHGDICPLRAALETARDTVAGGGESILVSVPAGTYSLAKGALPLGNAQASACTTGKCAVVLEGAGAGATVIDGHGASQLLAPVSGAALVGAVKVTLRRGDAEFGGAIGTPKGSPEQGLLVFESVLSEDASEDGGAIDSLGVPTSVSDDVFQKDHATYGGAIAIEDADLTVLRSTFEGNSVQLYGGAVDAHSETKAVTVKVIDSTLFGNSATMAGALGAAVHGWGAAGTTVAIRYSTVTGNTGTEGGALDGGSQLELEGSIVAGDSPQECAGYGAANAVLANIVFGSSACTFSGPTPLGVDPRLAEPAENGGLGRTLALLRGSPALNAGARSCSGAAIGTGTETYDERGLLRPIGGACDLGAFESAADAAVTLAYSSEPAPVSVPVTLTATVADRGRDPLSGVAVTVALPTNATPVMLPPGCAVFAGSPAVSCTVGALAPSQSVALPIVIRPAKAGALLASASVTAAQADYEPSNDTAVIAGVSDTPAPAPAPPGAPRAALIGRGFSVDSRGRVRLRVRCSGPAGSTCAGAVDLLGATGRLPVRVSSARNALLLGRARFTTAAGTTSTVTVRLAKWAFATLRGVGARRARVLLGSPGASAGARYSVTLRRARGRGR